MSASNLTRLTSRDACSGPDDKSESGLSASSKYEASRYWKNVKESVRSTSDSSNATFASLLFDEVGLSGRQRTSDVRTIANTRIRNRMTIGPIQLAGTAAKRQL